MSVLIDELFFIKISFFFFPFTFDIDILSCLQPTIKLQAMPTCLQPTAYSYRKIDRDVDFYHLLDSPAGFNNFGINLFCYDSTTNIRRDICQMPIKISIDFSIDVDVDMTYNNHLLANFNYLIVSIE